MGGMFNCWKERDSFQAPFTSKQSIYQLKASSYPDIKAGNCPCWKPTKTSYLQPSIIPDLFLIHPGFLPNACTLPFLPPLLAPDPTGDACADTCGQGGEEIFNSLGRKMPFGFQSTSVLLNITTAEPPWRGSGSNDSPILPLTPEIFQKRRPSGERDGGSCNVSQHFLKMDTPYRMVHSHGKSSIHCTPPVSQAQDPG